MVTNAIITAAGLMVSSELKKALHLARKAEGTFSILSPNASFIWVEKMTNAIPLVNPTTSGL